MVGAVGLSGCFKDLTAFEDGPRLTARPGTPTRTPVKGSIQDLGLGGSRDGYLYVPESYTPEAALPLFVALHGAGGEARNWASYPARAEAHGMIVLAPDSRERTWDVVTQGLFGPDVRFLRRGAGLHVRTLPGGPFADRPGWLLRRGLLRTLPGRGQRRSVHEPGGVLHRGSSLRAPHSPEAPPIFISHGRQDPILSFENTSSSLVPSLESAGYGVTFHAFDGGHEVPADVSEAALSWWLQS